MHSTSASPTNRLTISSCLGRMFSAVTSAMQPARIPLALLAAQPLFALIVAVLAVLLFFGLTRPEVRTWLDEP